MLIPQNWNCNQIGLIAMIVVLLTVDDKMIETIHYMNTIAALLIDLVEQVVDQLLCLFNHNYVNVRSSKYPFVQLSPCPTVQQSVRTPTYPSVNLSVSM